MANVSVETRKVVTLELTEKEAQFLNDLLYRHVAGRGYYDTGLDSIGKALYSALGESPDTFDTNNVTINYK